MPQVSRIAKLPIELRREVNARLLESGFGGYVELAAELKQRGFPISKSALHKYGQRLKRLACETEQDDFAHMLRAVPDTGLPMTVVTLVDLQTGAARVLTTPNSIADVEMLLEPLRDVASGDNEVIKAPKTAV